MTALQTLFEFYAAFPSAPVPLTLGRGGSGETVYAIDSASGKMTDGERESYSFTLTLRRKIYDGSAREELEELIGKLREYSKNPPLPPEGLYPQIFFEKSPKISYGSDFSASCEITLSYTYTPADENLPELALIYGGREIKLSAYGSYRLAAVSGLGAIPEKLGKSEKEGYTDTTPAEPSGREITAELYFASGFFRDFLSSLISGGELLKIKVKRGEEERFTYGYASSFEEEDGGGFYHGRLKFFCPTPYFYGERAEIYPLDKNTPLLAFPLCSIRNIGATSGCPRSSYVITVNNGGGICCGAEISICAKGGSTVNPSLLCNGEYIEISDTVTPSDEIFISTDKPSGIKKNGSDFYRLSLRSSFFRLKPGKNLITFSATSGSEFSVLSVAVRIRYAAA